MSLSEKERELIANSVIKNKIRNVLFVGGEPTLYIKDMNDIISRFGPAKPEIMMTTNGHFAQSEEAAVKVLSSVAGLSWVNLSYDGLHEKFLPEANIGHLFSACGKMKIGFDVLMALRSPMDLLLLNKLRKVGKFPVRIQKLLPAGAARKNDLGFRYPSFDKKVFTAVCPTRKKLIYLCGEGFTCCCASLAFESSSGRFVHPTVEGHFKSDFYKLISKNTLGGIARKFGLYKAEMAPEYSSPCVLCEYLFRSKHGVGF